MRPKNIQEVAIEFEKAEWFFEAKWRQRRVGVAGCIQEGPTLKIGDLKVNDDFFFPWPFAHKILILLGVPCRRVNLRGHGIGTLVKYFASWGIHPSNAPHVSTPIQRPSPAQRDGFRV